MERIKYEPNQKEGTTQLTASAVALLCDVLPFLNSWGMIWYDIIYMIHIISNIFITDWGLLINSVGGQPAIACGYLPLWRKLSAKSHVLPTPSSSVTSLMLEVYFNLFIFLLCSSFATLAFGRPRFFSDELLLFRSSIDFACILLTFFVGYAGVPLYNNNKIGLALIHINRKPGSVDSVKEFVDVFLLQELAAGDSRWNSLMSRRCLLCECELFCTNFSEEYILIKA